MEYLLSLTSIVQGNPVLQGVFGFFGLSVLTFILVKTPRFLLNLFYSQCTTRLVFYSTSSNWSDWNALQFTAFLYWFKNQPGFKYSRALTIESNTDLKRYRKVDEKTNVGPGVGNHLLFKGLRPFWINIVSDIGSGATTSFVTKYTVTIRTLGRRQQPIRDVVKEFLITTEDNEALSLYQFDNENKSWAWTNNIQKRHKETLFLNPEIEESLFGKTKDMLENKEWYLHHGLNHKVCFLLHGKPGTGKTTIIKSLASEFNLPLYQLNIGTLTASGLLKAMGSIKQKSVLYIEDIDSLDAVHSRDIEKDKTIKVDEKDDKVKLSDILNALDGVNTPSDLVIVITTNTPEILDGALVRKGRVDYSLEIPYLTSKEINRFIKYHYPKDHLESMEFKDMSGAELQGLFLSHMDNYEEFMEELKSK